MGYMSLLKQFIVSLFILSNFLVLGQGNYIIDTQKGHDKIPFELINNVIIIPVEINGIKRSFLLDTGVSRPILFDFINASDSIPILNSKKIFLKGLGNDGVVEALKSSHNTFKVGNAINLDQSFYIVFDSSIDFAPKLGVPIHGILGFDFFKDLIVEINYARKFLKITSPERYKNKKCRRCETFNIQFYNDKPYINVTVTVNTKTIPVKLLIDSGSSDALWLFENESTGLYVHDYYFNDILGYGLSGVVNGKRSKIDAVSFKALVVKNPKAAFPDPETIRDLVKIKGRKGSIGGELLKRFNCVVNYRDNQLTLKRNRNFKAPFSYNKSGITLENSGLRLVTESNSKLQHNFNPFLEKYNKLQVKAVYVSEEKMVFKKAFTISQIRDDSPAHRAGLRVGDVVLTVNGNDTKTYNLQKLMGEFYEDEGKKTILQVDRQGVLLKVKFNLESPLK
ncbi:PDZ domain-containing protein [Bizionia gelidisalsuginis]|uniref:PDZ domain-containing protein n=2 Tax=Bizionia gelidisalsuginis TaxID=291188 RepID=A0ABY3MAR5_9FLAO|nr:PDZ domain-containing protein [Bizionia gelidisalsuginis]